MSEGQSRVALAELVPEEEGDGVRTGNVDTDENRSVGVGHDTRIRSGSSDIQARVHEVAFKRVDICRVEVGLTAHEDRESLPEADFLSLCRLQSDHERA